LHLKLQVVQLLEQHGPNKQLAAAGDDSSHSYELLLLLLRSNFNTRSPELELLQYATLTRY
jgi:hypothetical protein